MAENQPENTDSIAPIATSGVRGACVQPVYVEREMKFYALPETELNTISLMNTLALVFFSVGSFLLSPAIGIMIETSYQENLTPITTVLLVMGIWSVQIGLAQTSAMSARVLELSLEDAIRLALQHNLDIERERFSPLIEQTEVGKAKADFDQLSAIQVHLFKSKQLDSNKLITNSNINHLFQGK